MTKEEMKIISEAAYSLGSINRAISTLQNAQKLFIVDDYSIQVRFDSGNEIFIPQCLIDDFKQKLVKYYTEEFNKIVKGLKTIEL